MITKPGLINPFRARMKLEQNPYQGFLMAKYDDLFSEDYSNLFDEDTEYNAFRSATTGFIESAIGAGDELDATIRLLSGEAQDWSQAIAQSRAELKAFEDANPNASMVINTMGFGAGLFIPGAGIAKIAQTGTKLDRALRVGELGATEGAIYGFLSGEGEDRLTSAGVGAIAGGALGGLSGAYLTKNADEIKKATRLLDAQTYKGKGSYIGGEEGFRNVGRAKESSRPGVTYDTSTASRQVQDIKDDAIIVERPSGESGTVGSVFLSTKDWMEKNVGIRAARLAEDAEIMARHDQREIDEIFDTEFLTAAELFDNNKGLKSLSLRMNKSIKEDRRVSWEDFTDAAKTPDEKQLLESLRSRLRLFRS